MNRPLIVWLGWAFIAMTRLDSAPRPVALFSDHAVLQRGVPVPVWGKAEPGEQIRVSYRDVAGEAVTDENGRWRLMLPALKSGPAGELIIEGETRIVVSDVIVGDVWFCSGQSNMGWTMAKSHESQGDIASADMPLIRRFRVERQASDEPLDEVKGEWVLSTPKVVPGWTAVGFYFARELHRHTGAPVGLLQASIGGTDIETWMSPRAIDSSVAGAAVRSRWVELLETYPQRKATYDTEQAAWKERKLNAGKTESAFSEDEPRAPIGPDSGSRPSRYFNGMVNPVIPYAICGLLWYQGENNAGRFEDYADLQVRLIRDWRERWSNPALPFLFVQIPAISSRNATGQGWALFREAQSKALAEPATGMAVTIDVGGPSAHPPYKRPVGERLALLARTVAYGETGVPASPRLLSATPDGSRLLLRFDSGGSPLVLREPGKSPAFFIAGSDKKFSPARAQLIDGMIALEADAVSKPVYVRYACQNYPAVTLYNTEGLPAAPFRTDSH